MDRELLQDSDGVNESFWDGLGVEFKAKCIFDFKCAPRGPQSARDGAPGRGATRGPRDGVPINSCPSVPGRLNFGGEIGGEIGGVGYGVFFAPASRSRDQKNTSKNTTIRHLDFHLQNPNLPEGGFNRRTDYLKFKSPPIKSRKRLGGISRYLR